MTQNLSHIPILTYHKITDRREIGLNTVPPGRFAEHIKYLWEEGFTALTFSDITGNNLPSRPIIITFDDGYSSVYHQALPTLMKHEFRAVVFIITNYIGKENTWDANLGGITFSHLNKYQIKELGICGMEIGSHGMSHRSLTFLTAETVFSEMNESRQKIFEIIGKYPQTIAYPFGLQNRQIREAAVECGYRYGCVNLWGSGRVLNPFCLQRIPVYRTDSVKNLRKKIITGWGNLSEITKLRIISFPALLTPFYQKFIKKIY